MSEEIRTSAQENANEEVKLSEILQVRRDKLKALQDAGADPFQITKYEVSHHAADVKEQYDALEGQEVTVAGRMMS